MTELIYGRRPVLEALRGDRTLHKLWIAGGTHGTEEILRLARERGVPVERGRREHLDKRVQGHHQGIVAQASAASFWELEDFLKRFDNKESSFPPATGGETIKSSWIPG